MLSSWVVKKKAKAINVAIVGGRDFADKTRLYEVMDELALKHEIACVVGGGATGADSLGAEWAKDRGIATRVFIPEWKKHGRKAGILRNGQIVDAADMLVAFWDGKSPGTRNSVQRAEKKGIPVVKEFY
ncbi:DUF2493 domain-containing protein [Acanthamoeba castellanii medusavirus]|uniref:DUF2493 domain-containing protein n=1 Tax=Acanthamoeba castellanii medusavirus J1 TaxID=3114988 RepID=A0A3T1CWH2_9VIRU|nr:DUF2493 domain-containing protein [Acanthamoeba castellanii medusavirus]BBI30159.1 DUF2493 domain-containing protein [Acanthamoeba castellanii medusavirus J1]